MQQSESVQGGCFVYALQCSGITAVR